MRHWVAEIGCGMCGALEETLEHFVLECRGLAGVRERHGVQTMGDVMCFGGRDTRRACDFLEEAWSVRSRILEGEG